MKKEQNFSMFQKDNPSAKDTGNVLLFGFSAQISWSLFVDCALYFVWSSAEFINFIFKFVV